MRKLVIKLKGKDERVKVEDILKYLNFNEIRTKYKGKFETKGIKVVIK